MFHLPPDPPHTRESNISASTVRCSACGTGPSSPWSRRSSPSSGPPLTSLKQELIPSLKFPQLVIVTPLSWRVAGGRQQGCQHADRDRHPGCRGLESTTATSSTNRSTMTTSFTTAPTWPPRSRRSTRRSTASSRASRRTGPRGDHRQHRRPTGHPARRHQRPDVRDLTAALPGSSSPTSRTWTVFAGQPDRHHRAAGRDHPGRHEARRRRGPPHRRSRMPSARTACCCRPARSPRTARP